MPELTRQGAHISINIFLDRAPPALAPYLHGAVSAVAAAACLVAAWFCVDATLGQFNQQIYTSPPFAMPKWAVTACLPYGFLSSGLYFARQLFGRHAAPAQAGESPL